MQRSNSICMRVICESISLFALIWLHMTIIVVATVASDSCSVADDQLIESERANEKSVFYLIFVCSV